ncbi:PEGA domain-containing protein [Patescibacteria group bacterium]
MFKKLIRLFFQVFVVFFFISATTYALLAAYGYQIDLLQQSIVKTSIIDINSELENVNIFVDGEHMEVKAPIQIKSIAPGKHHVVIEKEGYVTWKRSVKVTEDFVAKIDDVLLIPKDLEKFTTSIPLDFEYNELIYNENSLIFLSYEENKIYIYKLNQNGEFDIETINYKMDQLKNNKAYLVGSNNIVFADSKSALTLNLEDKTVKTIPIPNEFNNFILSLTPNLTGFYFTDDNLYSADINDDGSFIETSLLYESLTQNVDLTLDVISSKGDVFVMEGDHLFQYLNKQLVFIDNKVKSLSGVAPDGRNIALVRGNGEIMLYDKFKSSKELLARFASPVEEVEWYFDGKHIFLQKQKNLSLCDLTFDNCVSILELDEDDKFVVFPFHEKFIIVDDESITTYLFE